MTDIFKSADWARERLAPCAPLKLPMNYVVNVPDGARLNFQGVIVPVRANDMVCVGFDGGRPFIEVNGVKYLESADKQA